MMLSAAQSRTARAALKWGVRDFAAQAGVSPDTIARLERGEELKPATLAALRATLEAAGVLLIDPDDEAGPGVRLKDKSVR